MVLFLVINFYCLVFYEVSVHDRLEFLKKQAIHAKVTGLVYFFFFNSLWTSDSLKNTKKYCLEPRSTQAGKVCSVQGSQQTIREKRHLQDKLNAWFVIWLLPNLQPITRYVSRGPLSSHTLQHASPNPPNKLRFQGLCRWRFPCQEWWHSAPPSKIPRHSPNCIPDITLPVLDLPPLCYSFPRSTEASITQHAHHTPAGLSVSVAGKLSEASCDLWCIFASWPSLKGRCIIGVQSVSVGSFTPVFMKTRILPGSNTSWKS